MLANGIRILARTIWEVGVQKGSFLYFSGRGFGGCTDLGSNLGPFSTYDVSYAEPLFFMISMKFFYIFY